MVSWHADGWPLLLASVSAGGGRRAVLWLAALACSAAATAGPRQACEYSARLQGVSCVVMVDGQVVHELPVTQVWMAAGAGKQRLLILPERRLVAVRQTNRLLLGENSGFSDLEFLRLLLD